MSVIKVAFGFEQLKQLTTHSDTTSLHAHVYWRLNDSIVNGVIIHNDTAILILSIRYSYYGGLLGILLEDPIIS